MSAEQSTTMAVEKSLPEMRTEATSLLASGSELFEDGDYTDAAADLGSASELFAKVFGETADECGEAYLMYGKALLNVSIMENEVLGNALEGMELEDDAKTLPQVESPTKLKDEEITVVKSDVAKAFNEHFNAYNTLAQHHFVEVTDVCCEDSADSEVEDVNMDTDSPKSPSKPEATSAEDSPSALDAAAEDTSNLQLAWEMLELAKMIYERKAKDVVPEKKREVLSALWDATSGLGEVLMEAGRFSEALEEFSSCLEARKAVLPADSRTIAEAHFLKSRAEAALGKISESETSIKAAIAVLEARAVNLSKMELSAHLVEEIADLEGLGIDLEEILVEFKEGMTEHTKRKLSAGSPSAKLAGVEKAPKIDDAKPISATTVGIA